VATALIRSWAGLLAEILLRPFAQIFFSRDLRTGALLLGAMCMFPRVASAAVATVLVTAALVRALGLGAHVMREGIYACVATMIVLTASAFTPENIPLPLLVGMAAMLAVVITASWESLLGAFYLPPHSVPSALGAWTVLLVIRFLPLEPASAVLSAPLAPLPGGLFDVASWWNLPASLIYLRGIAPGVLVVAAIALHSRIMLVLAAVGMATAALLRHALAGAALAPSVDTLAGINAAYTAMAVGGLWFIPQPSSVLLAAFGAGLSCLLTYALSNFLALFYLPVLGLPFAIATQMVLLTARRRERDAHPQSTLPSEKPEHALDRHMMWTVRWAGAAPWISFRLPFRGPWTVTQGNDGRYTHKGPWRHGFDFEVQVSGKLFDGTGADLRDYHCYGRPVLAAGAGTVVLVVDGVPDNRPGQLDTVQNWGNVVVISHGPALFTVYAHLQPRSLRVKVGEYVALGAEIGRCGNSGRSAVPHLHFQAQKGAALGSPTLPVSFADVVDMREAVPQVLGRVVPEEGAVVRTQIWDEALAGALTFVPGTSWRLRSADGGEEEPISVEIDLWGRTVLRSPRASLYLMLSYSGLTAVDFVGQRGSLLRPLFVALARVPFDHASSAVWQDRMPLGRLLPRWLSPIADLGAMLFPLRTRAKLEYRLTRDAGTIEIAGRGRGFQSRARLSVDGDRHGFELHEPGRTSSVVLERLLAESRKAA
jgi:urea transporter